jgi:hypothetical protein
MSCGASAQLVEAPEGTLLTSHTVQSSLGDLFRLQDDIARRVVEALSLPLVGGDALGQPAVRCTSEQSRLPVAPGGSGSSQQALAAFREAGGEQPLGW